MHGFIITAIQSCNVAVKYIDVLYLRASHNQGVLITYTVRISNAADISYIYRQQTRLVILSVCACSSRQQAADFGQGSKNLDYGDGSWN